MDDWEAEVDVADVADAIERQVDGRAGADPEAVATLARRLEAANSPVLVAGPDIDASGAWELAVALAERQNLPVFASPPPGGGRLGFPEGHPNFRGVLPPAIGPVAETLKGRDLILVVGSSVFPYYPNIPGAAAARGRRAGPDHLRPRRGRAGADGRRDRRRREADAGVARSPRSASPTATSASPLPEPTAGPEEDPITGTAAMHALAAAFPEDGIVVLEAPSSTSALRNQLRISKPGSYYFGAGGGLGFGLAAAVGVQLAQPDRPVVCVLGEGSAQYAITAFWSAVAYDVPVTFLVLRNSEYAILKWFAEPRGGRGRAGARPAGARHGGDRGGLRGRRGQGRRGRRAARGARGSDRGEPAGAGRGPGGAGDVALLEGVADRPARAQGRAAGARAAPASADAAPDWVAAGTPEPLRGELIGLLGAERVLTRATDLVRYASDASPYRLFPKAVVDGPRRRRRREGVRLRPAPLGIPVTFRAGGTSLNGQGQSDGILVDVRRHFRGVEVEDGGARARVKPGTLLGHVNRVLAPHGRKLGPDPASTDIACVGGVIANNSGGMRCGVARDSYSTVRELTFVLASGTVIDTAAPDAEQPLRARPSPSSPPASREIRDEIRADAELSERIRRKFEIKNTTGYRLCAFLDADDPARDLPPAAGRLRGHARRSSPRRCSRPCPSRRRRPSPGSTSRASTRPLEPVPDLVAAGATRGRADGRAGADRRGAQHPRHARVLEGARPERRPRCWSSSAPTTRPSSTAAEARAAEVLAEPRADPRAGLSPRRRGDRGRLAGARGAARAGRPAAPARDGADHRGRLRAAGADRRVGQGHPGAARRARLPAPGSPGTPRPGTSTSCSPRTSPSRRTCERYEAFMEGLVELVIDKYDGSLKAEHGTGLNMAPYVEREWGAKATELMWRIKRLADPDGVLAPGVVLNDDPGVHLRNLKTTPPIEEEANTCVECGFCEPVCPSRHLTTDPAPADRPAPRDGAPAAGLAGARGAARAVRVRRARDLRRRRHLRARLPARDRHGQARQGAARPPAHAPAPSSVALRLAGRWDVGRARRARGPADRRPRRLARGAARGASRAARRALSPSWSPSGRRTCRAPAPAALPPTTRAGPRPSTCPPASTASSGGRATAPARALEPPGGAGRGLGARGPAGLDPARRGRPLLRDPVELEGLSRRRPADGQPHGRRALALERTAASCRSSSTRAPARSGSPRSRSRCSARRTRERHAKLELLDSVAWARERLLPSAERRAQARRGRGPPDLLDPPSRPRRRLGGARRASSPTRSSSRRPRPAAASRATAACSTPSCRAPRPPTRRPSSRPQLRRLPLLEPHLRDRPPAGHRPPLRELHLHPRAADSRLSGRPVPTG